MTTLDRPRLIEVAFPLKQASVASVHEKNVRHGHISTLHIWPARRPLAACRAASPAAPRPCASRLAGDSIARSWRSGKTQGFAYENWGKSDDQGSGRDR